MIYHEESGKGKRVGLFEKGISMKRKRNRFFRGTAAVILAGCLFLQGIGESVAEASFSGEEAGTALCEEGFESGSVGGWSAKDGASLSVETDNPQNGSCCMKITGRETTSSGAKLEIGNRLQTGSYLHVSAYARYASGPEKKKIQLTMSCDGRYYTLGSRELARGEWGEITGGMAVPRGVRLSDAILFFETPWVQNPSAQDDLMDIYVDDIKASLYPFCDTESYPSLKELYKDQFRIGLAVPDLVLNTPEYSRLFERQCSSMTMENEMKPACIMDQKTSKNNLSEYKEHVALNFNSYITGMDYAKQHGLAVRGHTLVWHSQTPEWFFYEDYDVSGKRADRDLMLKRMENYIKEVISWTETNYPGVIYAWDVVNEAVADYFGEGSAPMRQEDSPWYQTIGADFVQKAFEYARKYTKQYGAGDIKLFYNDYNEYFSAKREGIVSLLKPVKEQGNIDGVGMQSHFDTRQPLEGNNGYMTAVRRFRDELGLELHVTELDIGIADGDTQKSQGVYYQQFMEALLKEKREGANITSVTFWGLTDGLSWRPGENCLLFYDDLSRKPAFEGVVQAIGNTQAAIDKINAIGKVELTESCKEKIAEARNLYDSLTEEQKALVPADILSILTQSETEYKKQEEEDRKKPPRKIAIGRENVSAIAAQTYTGQPLQPVVTVTCNGRRLVKDRDYTIVYRNNINIGQAVALITAKGDYEGKAEREFAITVAKNRIYTVGDYRYKITDARTDGKGAVALTGVRSSAVKKKLKKINVAATVKIGGRNFKVTSVGNAACKGCTKATQITIGKNVKTIGSSAFSGCKKVSAATIGSNVTKIGAKAFYQCKNLKKITIKSKKMASVGKNTLKGIHKKAVIKCPKRKLESYRKQLKSKGQSKSVKISF